MGDSDFKFMPDTMFEMGPLAAGFLFKQMGIVALLIVDVVPIASAPTRFGGFRHLDPVAQLLNHLLIIKSIKMFFSF